MKRAVIRLACAMGVLVLMACGAYALSSGDSLITLDYLEKIFIPSAVQKSEQGAGNKLQETYDGAKSTLDSLQQGYLDQATGGEVTGTYSTSLQSRDWDDGDVVSMTTGTGFLMLNGSATLAHSGAVIDVTLGKEVASGTRLTANHRYLVGEDTLAQITVISGAAQMGLQGAYNAVDGTGKPTPFYDVCQGDWYYAPVNYVYENSLFSGMDAHTFGPSAAMNRAMLMTVLYQLAGAPSDELQSANVSFSDVPDSAWYASYVKWGAAQGITAGTSETTFTPEQQVTRQQVVVLLYSFATNYLGLTMDERADLSQYQDLNQASQWAQDALSWAVAEGIIGSASADALVLSPQTNTSRAEVATMLRAFSEKIL